MAELYAFLNGSIAGVFTRSESGQVGFEYVSESGSAPISLSLPRDGNHAPDAALNYLDNLLPDHQEVRDRWARARGLSGADPFTLLTAYGEDVAGAVSLTADESLTDRRGELVIEATEDDIAERIAALRHNSSSWSDPRARPRMSLAGMQGKFTLAQDEGRWMWPTYEMPSTHILKPPSDRHKGIERFESSSLELARSIGVQASVSESASFLEQPTFIVKRWDRAPGIRLPAEDMNQALGYATESKYDVGAPELARLLSRHGQARQFVRQLAFNVSLGNADAHSKNYSVLFVGDQVRLAPLYDAVPVHFWPAYSQRFAMPIGKALLPAQLTEANWRLFAAESDLDADMVCEEAFTVMAHVAERYRDVFEAAGADQNRLSMIAKYVKKFQKAIPADFIAASVPDVDALRETVSLDTGRGDVWVEPYIRSDGAAVEGHFRSRPSR